MRLLSMMRYRRGYTASMAAPSLVKPDSYISVQGVIACSTDEKTKQRVCLVCDELFKRATKFLGGDDAVFCGGLCQALLCKTRAI